MTLLFAWFLRKASNAVEQLRAGVGDTRFDAVIDFSAYSSDVVQDALEALQGQIQLYIYISTDSVYEVSSLKHRTKRISIKDA